ncbi:MAG: bifunctional DNA primase/polymerase [bacterium]|nr:bifunctional DNA primase/polymerase [bacterium]
MRSSEMAHLSKSQTSTDRLLLCAIEYARAGWSVLPVRKRGKEPLTHHGFKDATTDAETIRQWAEKWPGANIGLAVPPGFLVLDIDSADALNRLRAEDLHLPATSRATTGRGQHFWYATGDVEVRNRVSIFPGVDVRAPGGYVVAPPSQHPSGRIYRWEVGQERSAIAACPVWRPSVATWCWARGQMSCSLCGRSTPSPSTRPGSHPGWQSPHRRSDAARPSCSRCWGSSSQSRC